MSEIEPLEGEIYLNDNTYKLTHMKRDVSPRVLQAFERLKRSEDGCLELKRIKGRFYVYRATSEWDRENKKVRKTTSYLGAISNGGIFKPRKQRVQESKREVFEYGNGALAHHFLRDVEEKLKEFTPYYRELISTAIVKSLDPKPLRLVASRWEKLYLQREIGVSLSPQHLSRVLRDVGRGVRWWYGLFEELAGDDLLLYDLSTVFTHSKNIRLAEKGYNPEGKYNDQIGVVLAFSTGDSLPAGVEVYWGSMKDITTIRDFLNRFRRRKVGFVLDRGFWSEKLLKDFRGDGVNYIAPVRKNSKLLDLRWVRWKGPFSYRGRTIRWGRKKTELGYLYLFYDPLLRGEEEKGLLRKVENGGMSLEEFEEKKRVAGVIGLVSDLDKDGLDIFDLYKGKQDVELAFDAMKNTLDSDKTYMHTDEAVRGYFFLTFLSLRIYFRVLRRLRERKLTQKISVGEVFYELSKVQRIVEPTGREYYVKIPKRARRILEIFPEGLPMG